MKEELRKKYALMSIGALAACIAAIILLLRSVAKNSNEPDVVTLVIAVFLMSAGALTGFHVKKKRKEADEQGTRPQEEAVDEEWEALLDHFYDMEREDEFYSCLEAHGPIETVDDYEHSVAAFEKNTSEAVNAGSKEYIWRANRDSDVCIRCRRYNGKRFAWNNPPRGGHPGCAPGCRCEAEPVMPLERPRSGARTKAARS